jgi:uncharacterized membrane protein YedE/YeeE
MQIMTAFVTGLIFGLGLILSEMTNPAKIIGFLDIFGNWDPSLVLVMLGAITVNAVSFKLTKSRQQSFFGQQIKLPKSSNIDHRLITGSLIFGVGWGLAGYCPGPALTSVLLGGYQPLIFAISMLIGMGVFEVVNQLSSKKGLSN